MAHCGMELMLELYTDRNGKNRISKLSVHGILSDIRNLLTWSMHTWFSLFLLRIFFHVERLLLFAFFMMLIWLELYSFDCIQLFVRRNEERKKCSKDTCGTINRYESCLPFAKLAQRNKNAVLLAPHSPSLLTFRKNLKWIIQKFIDNFKGKFVSIQLKNYYYSILNISVVRKNSRKLYISKWYAVFAFIVECDLIALNQFMAVVKAGTSSTVAKLIEVHRSVWTNHFSSVKIDWMSDA